MKNKTGLGAVLVLMAFLIGLFSLVQIGNAISSCQNLNTANAVYALTADVSSTGTCFTILANNVTLDCAAYKVYYGQAESFTNAVYSENYNNLTVKNCTMISNNTAITDNYAINLANSRFSTISYNNITTLGNLSDGMDIFLGSDSATVFNNIINISGKQAYGIFQKNSSQGNMTNNKIISSGEDAPGIVLRNASFSTMYGNNITATGYISDGIRFYDNATNNTISGNIFSISGSLGYGILINATKDNSPSGFYSRNAIENNNITAKGAGVWIESSNATFSNNNITVSESSSFGIRIECLNITYSSCFLYNSLSNLNIKTIGGSSDGIYAFGIGNNTFSSMDIDATGKGINFIASSGNRFINSRITAPTDSDLYYYVYDSDWDGTFNKDFFINTTFSKSDVTLTGATNPAKIEVSWYLDAYVNNTNGNPVSEANVTGWNATGSLSFSVLSNSSGIIPTQTLLEYEQIGAAKNYRTNYTVNASSDSIQKQQKVNLTESKSIFFTMETTPPQYSSNRTNTTKAGQPALFSLYWADNANLSGYIFSFDNATGTFVNDSWAEMSGTGNWSNVTKTINSTVGATVRWRVYANDTSNYWNGSQVFSFATISPNSISACQNLNTANAVYILTANVSSANYCFHIIANNVTLDGNGFTINFSQSATGYAINNSGGYDNITIRNINIVQGGTSSNSVAIKGSGMGNSTITDNNITVSSYNGYGINLDSSSDSNIVSNNSITTTDDDSYGVNLYSSANNTVANNTVKTSGYYSYGIYLYSAGGLYAYSIIINNNITTSGYGGYGIYNYRTFANTISSNNVTTLNDNSHGIRIYPPSDFNTLADNIFRVFGADSYGIYLASSYSNNITGGSIFSNQSYDYYLWDVDAATNFTDTNFTAQRHIYFYDEATWFNYNNQTSGDIWLKTSVSAASSINRTLVGWDNTLMKWNDTNSTSGKTARYNITGLQASTQYTVTNSSKTGSYSQPLTTDSGGNLPSFTIFLIGNTEVRISESTPPSISIQSPLNQSYGARWVWANATLSEAGSWCGVSLNGTANQTLANSTGRWWLNLSVPSEGSNNVKLYCNDTAGNMGNSSLVYFTSDVTKPVLTLALPANTTYNSASRTLNYTVSDNLALDKCWYGYNSANTTLENCANASFAALDNQVSSLILYANDTAGNVNSTNITFTVDTSYPQISFSSGTEANDSSFSRNWTYANVSITETNFQNLTFRLYNATDVLNSTTFTDSTRYINWTNLADGAYYFNATAFDSAGNPNATETRKQTLDTTPPMSVANLSNQSQADIWIYWNWTSPSDADFNHTEIWVNGSFVANTSGNYYNATVLNENTWYQLGTRTVDNTGNINATWANNSAKTLADILPPSISIQSPLNQSYGARWVWANATLSEAGSWCGVSLNGTANQTLANSTGRWWLNLSVPSEGSNNVKLYCNDTAGNMGNSSLVYFTSDVTKPVLTGILSSSITSSSAAIAWTTDEQSNSTVFYGTTANTTLNKTNNSSTISHSVTLTGLSASTLYYYNVSSCDSAGNCNASSQYNFTTSAASSETPQSPGGGGGGGGTTVTLTKRIIVTPNESVKKVTVYLKIAVENPSLTVVKILNVPVSAPSGTVYQYLNITKKNFNNSNIENSTVEFEVKKSWISDNNISKIYLARHDNGWNKLRTEPAGSAGEYNKYVAYADAFSYFAVIGEKQAVSLPAGGNVSQPETNISDTSNIAFGNIQGIFSSNLAAIVLSAAAIFVAAFYISKSKKMRMILSKKPAKALQLKKPTKASPPQKKPPPLPPRKTMRIFPVRKTAKAESTYKEEQKEKLREELKWLEKKIKEKKTDES